MDESAVKQIAKMQHVIDQYSYYIKAIYQSLQGKKIELQLDDKPNDIGAMAQEINDFIIENV